MSITLDEALRRRRQDRITRTIRWSVLVLASVSIGFQVGAVGRHAVNGEWWKAALFLPLITLNGWLGHRNWKELRNGRHRQPQEDSRDPGALATAVDITQPTIDALRAVAATEGTGPGVELERVKSDLPILAHRVARLAFGAAVPFLPYTNRRGFGVDAEATCERDRRLALVTSGSLSSRPYEPHNAPGVDCSCGFHALPPDVEPWASGPELVTLLVELSGVVVEHERGYRAQHQRVVEVQMPPCPYCGDEAGLVRVGLISDFRCEVMTGVTCFRHQRGDGMVTIPDLRRLLGVPVTCQSLPVPEVREAQR